MNSTAERKEISRLAHNVAPATHRLMLLKLGISGVASEAGGGEVGGAIH